MKDAIYLDHASTSPMHPDAAKEMAEALTGQFGNASSIHRFGRSSRGFLDQARQVFAKSIHADPSEIIITSGGTESDNTAILKTAEAREHLGKHIITTSVEHHAVIRPMEYLESKGFEVTYLPVDQKGRIQPEDVKEALRPDTILVSVMYGNNEVGTVMPIEEIGAIIKESDAPAYFHTDAVQAYGLLDIDVQRDNIDLLSVSAHKINGPKGLGFLYVKAGIYLPSFMLGGEQEMKRRAGTENIPGIIGFKKAAEIMMAERQSRRERYRELAKKMLEELDTLGVETEMNGDPEHSLGHILNLHIKGIKSEQLIIHLDLAGIAVSAGSACTAGNIDPSHVLTAMYGAEHAAISESLRISFGMGNTVEDAVQTAQAIKKAADRLKKE